MIDRTGRRIDYLRISVTDRCNLRCRYCMPETGIPSVSHSEILSYDEIERIVSCAAGLGISKIKITGGEPLVRKNCPRLIRQLKAIPGIEHITLTTNGVLLAEQISELAEAGLEGVNISLDTLDPETFRTITRRDGLEQVLSGMDAAVNFPGIRVKINCVPMEINREEYARLALLAKNRPVDVRFIEMMPMGYGKQYPVIDEPAVIGILEKEFGPLTENTEARGFGPAHYYSIENFTGRIGFISALSHKFCSSCNRVRLTSDGFLKQCLQYPDGTDLKSLIRRGCSDAELKETMEKTISGKPKSHQFGQDVSGSSEKKTMSQIGG